jgi:Zn-dependent peptidase ImmA (M78 family)/transcriptional regulator with XRE-family HTH domain
VVARAQPAEEPWLNPDVLKWAREWRGRTLEEAAMKVKKQPDDIAAWERGDKTPTVKQARALAAFYDRAFLELLLPEPPPLPEPVSLHDYRMHRQILPPSESWEFREIQGWAETQRINALDLYEEIGESPPEFPTSLFARPNDTPSSAAERIRQVLGFPVERQAGMTVEQARKLPDILRGLFESTGILTLKRTDLVKFRVRGICIAEFPLPVIVITKESPAAQAFTLIHELGHVVRRASGISGFIERRKNPLDIEGWCNKFAGAFLMPESYLRLLVGPVPLRPAASIADNTLKKYARSLSVSPHAMLVRMVDLGYVQADYYWKVKRPEFDSQEEEYTGGGRAVYYGSRYRAMQGDLYTGLVLDAWGTDRITNHNAAEFMGIKNIDHLYAIRDHFGDS